MSEDITKQPIRSSPPEPTEPLMDYSFTDYTAPRPYPWQMTVAGVLWLVLGALMLSVVGVLAASTMIRAGGVNAGGQNHAPSNSLLMWLSLSAVFGVSMLFYGVRSVRGTVRKLVVNLIASIGIGLYELGWVGYRIVAGQLNHPNFGAILFTSVEVLSAVLLLAAGVMALLGRNRYELWRTAQIYRREH